MSSTSKQWIQQAFYDLDTAHSMFKSGRYLYVFFCCQQAIEKMLKAIIVHRKNELPPRIHQLTRLADVAGLGMNQDKKDFLRKLSIYYIKTRYPDEIIDLSSNLNKESAQWVLNQTQEIIQWLHSKKK